MTNTPMNTLKIAILLGLGITHANAAKLTVTSTNDFGPGTLRDAMERVRSGDEIVFADTVRGTIQLTQSLKSSRSPVKITGPGPGRLTLSSANTILKLTGHWTVTGLTFADAKNGAISIYSEKVLSRLTLRNCKFLNNGKEQINGNQGYFATSIFVEQFEAVNCLFQENNNSILVNATEGKISNCEFVGNTGQFWAIGKFAVESSTFSENTPRGLLTYHPSTVANCYFINNEVGLELDDEEGVAPEENWSITNCVFVGNKFAGMDIWNGGNGKSSGKILNCTFLQNGTGIYAVRNRAIKIEMGSTIVAENLELGNADIRALRDTRFTSLGFNFVGNSGSLSTSFGPTDQIGYRPSPLDPGLSAVEVNGLPTFIPKAKSPVLDKGFSFGSEIDIRGRKRPVDFSSIANAQKGDGTDIGAFERQKIE